MRIYCFGNMYLSSIQQGIQATHVIAEMFVKYSSPDKESHYSLHEWARSYKTIILLNGGHSSNIWSLIKFFSIPENPYPWTYFTESSDALDSAITSVGIVLPEKIYDTAKRCGSISVRDMLYSQSNSGMSHGLPTNLSEWEMDLIDKLPTYDLAI
jgi:hypothetical protein